MVITKNYKDLEPVSIKESKKRLKPSYDIIIDKQQLIFVVSSGLIGTQFNKTAGYFSDFPGVQTFQCLAGSGIVLIQRNDEFGEAKEFKMISLNPLRQFIVPAGWVMSFINTSSNLLVVLRSGILDGKYLVPKSVIEKRGLAYFIVEKKGEIVFESNPYYKVHPQITTE